MKHLFMAKGGIFIDKFSNMKVITLGIVSLIIATICSAQSKKELRAEREAHYYAVKALDTNELKKGMHLELAQRVDKEAFIEIFIRTNNVPSKKHGGYTYVKPVHESDSFRYFLNMANSVPLTLYKVSRTEIAKIDFSRLNRSIIDSQFDEQIIGEAAKGDNYYKKYDYTPLAYCSKIVITCEVNLLNNSGLGVGKFRIFQAIYDIETGEMKKLHEGKEAKY